MKNFNNLKIGIIGLGYVGLPLAISLTKKFKIVAYDINLKRINDLKKFKDITNEIETKKLKLVKNKISFSNRFQNLQDCNVFIITVPTPITKKNKPDLKSIINVAKKLSNLIKKKSLIILESTVYPGVTENILGKIIEKKRGLKINKDFFLGYSPERINPGDKKHTVETINKVVSGSNEYATKLIFKIYKSITKAKIFIAKDIKTAEAAKVIENTQRDLNIAFMNELLLIFNKMNLNIYEVLKSAKTKWNFINFQPGLVGGHCIGVDPYYLTYAAKKIGVSPKIILSGRKINNNVSKYLSNLVINKLKNNPAPKLLVLGYTFKENVPDIRNTKVKDLYETLSKKKNYKIYINDPYLKAKPKNLRSKNKNIFYLNKIKKNYFDFILLLVPHNSFLNLGRKNIIKFGKKNSFLLDLKGKISGKFIEEI